MKITVDRNVDASHQTLVIAEEKYCHGGYAVNGDQKRPFLESMDVVLGKSIDIAS